MTHNRLLWKEEAGAMAAEFSLVLPLMMLFILGIIDVGRYVWSVNKAEKASQMAVRYAVATNMVPQNIASFQYTGSPHFVTGGNPVPLSAFTSATCVSGGCTCIPSTPCGWNSAAFSNIVDRARAIDDSISASNVVVKYENSGLGFAGDQDASDVSPLVTVAFRDLQFKPLGGFLKAGFGMPAISAALTLEDGVGTVGN
jgi:hypothetical protein